MVVYGTMLPTSLGAPQRRSGMRAGAAVAVAAAALVVLVGLGMHSSSSMLLSDNALDLDAVSDTTGRYLSRNAILSSHIPSGGGDSDDEKAVLEAAAGLPQSAHRASARQAFRPNEYVNDYGTGAVSRKKQQLTIKRQQAKLDQLNHGYASQMQKYLTGSKRVGAVETAINSHTANYLENTGRFNKKMRPATEAYILRSAEAQKTKEAKGLVGALSGPMWGSAIPRAVLSEGEARQARFGVVHTPDGFVLRTAATGARKAQTTSLDLIGAKGCECMGNDDEDKGPKCACKGDPTFPSVDNSFSDEEVTEWKQPEVEPTAKEAEDAFAAEQEAKGQEEAAQEAAGAMAAKGRKVQVLKAAAKTVGVKAEQDSINAFLQDVLNSAEATKGVAHASLPKLRATVKNLQDVATREPQARVFMAARLNKLSATILAPPAGQQALTDYTNVYIPPDVDDLDNYLQGVLDEVSRTEIPSLDDDAAAKGRVESLMPMDPTRNVWGRSHATNRGKFLDNMEWQHHPFDTAAEEADNLAKATEDVVTPMDTAMVHGAPNMRSEKHGADHVRNAYGYQHNDASAEVPVYTIDSPDTAQAAGVLTESSLNKGSKLCETINCDGDGPNGPPADDEPAAPVKAAELGSPAAKMDAMRAFQEDEGAVPEERKEGMGAKGHAEQLRQTHKKARRSTTIPMALS
mmetsp:Transcript_14500/g.32420  ORF Transcript_14500/g.32420 Transcript_14500/m.32420 type:complete len:687 (+) Transcript_14500:3-2063(+)